MTRFTLFICTALLALPLLAENFSPTLADWQRTAQNPLSPNFSLPVEYKYHAGAPDGEVHIGSFGAIMPVRFEGWDLINQLTLNVMGTPGDITGIRGIPEPYTGDGHGGSDGYAAGLADSFFTSYISPRMRKNLSVGIGATFVLPTDEPSRELGSGKFSVGPAAMVVYQPKDWTLSLQAQQVWSIFGSTGRSHVSQMIIKPTIHYNLPNGWYLLSNMEVIANWTSAAEQRWTVPVGAGIGKLFALGENAIDARVESYYNAVTPNAGPTWSIGASFSFIFGEL
ncbi:MAG: hypothetical protein GQ581_07355 [Methyloprofundus sp.]|nr:hypothetical protein [Methyloprofundus sp.]